MSESASQASRRAWYASFALSARNDPAARMLNVDLLAVLIAALLPWTTSGVAIAAVLWIVAVLFTLDPPSFVRSLRRLASAMPLALFALAVLGTLWSEAPWPARLHGINPAAKLLVVPLLLYHFARSRRAHWVLAAFIVSCTLLMVLSCVVLLQPGWKLGSAAAQGVAVKSYI